MHLEVRLEHLLVAAGVPFSRPLRGGRGLDFLVKTPEHGRVGVVVKDFFPRTAMLGGILGQAKLFAPDCDRFVLVTPAAPSPERRGWYVNSLAQKGIVGDWLAIGELLPLLGVRTELDLTSPEAGQRLEEAALRAPRAAPTAPHDSSRSATARRRLLDLDRALERATPSRPATKAERHRGLRRALSPELFDRVMADQRPPDEVLGVGLRVPSVTVVVSDLKNFTKLVRLAQPDDLRDCMNDYYRRARRSVWQHGGVLEKFIGDAVLAIFNYPYPRDDAATQALRFCRDLVALGREILGELSSAMVERVIVGDLRGDTRDHPRDAGATGADFAAGGAPPYDPRSSRTLETGTRIGVASGPVWVMDIGFDELEPSFIGDAMNRASRLEGASPLDGALLDQVTRHELTKLDPAFVDTLDLKPGPCQFRGLDYDISTWEIPPSVLAALPD